MAARRRKLRVFCKVCHMLRIITGVLTPSEAADISRSYVCSDCADKG